MKRKAVDQTSLPNCKECGAELDKSKLKGNLCMKCHYQYMKGYRRRKRTAAIEHLGGKCIDCGGVFPECVYDFHHLGDKEAHVSTMIKENRKLEAILNEASKCELLCANCHRIRHFL